MRLLALIASILFSTLIIQNAQGAAATSFELMTKYFKDAPEGASNLWTGARVQWIEASYSIGLDVTHWNSEYTKHNLSNEATVTELRAFSFLHTGYDSFFSLYGGPALGVEYSSQRIKTNEFTDSALVPHVIAGIRAGNKTFGCFVEGDYSVLSDFDGVFGAAGLFAKF